MGWTKMYDYELRKSVEAIFLKLAKKSPKQLEIVFKKQAQNGFKAYMVLKKIEELVDNPHRYKNLRRPLQHLKRVHIDRSFVLVFSIDEDNKLIIIEDYDHHDNVYK